MTSSTSCSTRRAIWAAAAIAAIAGCRHKPDPAPPPKIAVFAVQNAASGSAPLRRLTEAVDAAIEPALREAGITVVPRGDLEAVLARERLRFTGGVDRKMAKVLREELGVDAVLVPTLEAYSAEAPPAFSLAVRLVSAGERPVVLWANAASRAGDDAPGLLGLGRVAKAEDLERSVIGTLARSLQRHVSHKSAGEPCEDAGRFGPRRSFRAPDLDDVGRLTVAVLPFTNETSRRNAGEVIRGQFVAQLARSRSFVVLDPAVVREELLGHRMVLEDGVSVDQAMALLDVLDADLVLSGYVHLYQARAGAGAPKAEFSAYVIDRKTAQVVWSSTSTADGNAGVFFFGAGRVKTVSTLSCRMVRGVVDGIVGRRRVDPEVLTDPQTLREARTGRSSRVGSSVAMARED